MTHTMMAASNGSGISGAVYRVHCMPGLDWRSLVCTQTCLPYPLTRYLGRCVHIIHQLPQSLRISGYVPLLVFTS
jgi:hypothetical protein